MFFSFQYFIISEKLRSCVHIQQNFGGIGKLLKKIKNKRGFCLFLILSRIFMP
jgi:hypothetical protein